MKRVFSGIQPTGKLHLGNYLGAIRNWIGMQQEYECIFCIVDLHAITLPQNPKELNDSIYEVTAAYLACGIDPAKSTIFVQSAVPEHSELAWILGCMTPLGWLNRMTQFKEKAGKDKEKAALGLYNYPVLMAADILAYRATHVPVGEDQKQHLELARDIAGAFNRFAGEDFFPLPEPVILPQAARIMSLRDGTKKMSKSDPSDYSRIHLNDTAEDIAAKIRKAKSDMADGIAYDVENRPEAANLLDIYVSLSGITVKDAAAKFASSNFSSFKQELAEVAVAHLAPITERMRELLADRAYLDSVLAEGAARARAIATPVLAETRRRMGFWSVPS